MSETHTQDALIARVRKLMAMANHPGSNENEAAVAASKVQEILAEHNLDMAQLNVDEAATSAGAEKRAKTPHDKAAMYQYQRDLMAALAKNNFCMHFIEEVWKRDPRAKHEQWDEEAKEYVKMRRVKAHVLLGRRVNIEVTKITYDYLVETMDRLLPYTGMEKRGKEALLWLAGCTERLTERLDERRAEMEKASAAKAQEEAVRTKHPGAATDGKSLVVLADVYGSEEDLNNDAVRGYEPGTTARKRREQEAESARWVALREAKRAAIKATNPDASIDVIWRMQVWDEDRATAEEKVAAAQSRMAGASKPETETQRRRRKEREARRGQRWREEADRRYYREQSKRSHPAYKAGKDTGGNIGLDPQVAEQKARRIK